MTEMASQQFPAGYQQIQPANVDPDSLNWLYQYIQQNEIWGGQLVTVEFYLDPAGNKYAVVQGGDEGYLLREVCLPATMSGTLLAIFAGLAVLTATAMVFLPGGKRWRPRRR